MLCVSNMWSSGQQNTDDEAFPPATRIRFTMGPQSYNSFMFIFCVSTGSFKHNFDECMQACRMQLVTRGGSNILKQSQQKQADRRNPSLFLLHSFRHFSACHRFICKTSNNNTLSFHTVKVWNPCQNTRVFL